MPQAAAGRDEDASLHVQHLCELNGQLGASSERLALHLPLCPDGVAQILEIHKTETAGQCMRHEQHTGSGSTRTACWFSQPSCRWAQMPRTHHAHALQ